MNNFVRNFAQLFSFNITHILVSVSKKNRTIIPKLGMHNSANGVTPSAHGKGRQNCTRINTGRGHLDVSTRRHIVHLFNDLDKAPEDIAPVIQSPRRAGSADVRTIKNALAFYEVYGHVENIGRRPRLRRMSSAHTNTLIAIVKENPWLYVDKISDILYRRCRVSYHSGNCYKVLIESGYSHNARRILALRRCDLSHQLSQKAEYSSRDGNFNKIIIFNSY